MAKLMVIACPTQHTVQVGLCCPASPAMAPSLWPTPCNTRQALMEHHQRLSGGWDRVILERLLGHLLPQASAWSQGRHLRVESKSCTHGASPAPQRGLGQGHPGAPPQSPTSTVSTAGQGGPLAEWWQLGPPCSNHHLPLFSVWDRVHVGGHVQHLRAPRAPQVSARRLHSGGKRMHSTEQSTPGRQTAPRA